MTICTRVRRFFRFLFSLCCCCFKRDGDTLPKFGTSKRNVSSARPQLHQLDLSSCSFDFGKGTRNKSRILGVQRSELQRASRWTSSISRHFNLAHFKFVKGRCWWLLFLIDFTNRNTNASICPPLAAVFVKFTRERFSKRHGCIEPWSIRNCTD